MHILWISIQSCHFRGRIHPLMHCYLREAFSTGIVILSRGAPVCLSVIVAVCHKVYYS